MACEQPTHEERVTELRAKYEASLNGFAVRETPVAMDLETVPGEGEAATDEALDEVAAEETGAVDVAGEEGEMEAGEAMEPMMRYDVILDIVVRHTSDEMLPGITLDLSHADAAGVEKEHRRLWVDTSDLAKGDSLQVNETLEDVDYDEGDGFHVEVRRPIPAAERGEYRELAPGGSPE
jgi:hypothetical protein